MPCPALRPYMYELIEMISPKWTPRTCEAKARACLIPLSASKGAIPRLEAKHEAHSGRLDEVLVCGQEADEIAHV